MLNTFKDASFAISFIMAEMPRLACVLNNLVTISMSLEYTDADVPAADWADTIRMTKRILVLEGAAPALADMIVDHVTKPSIFKS